ncbi:hypothetical protein [Streptomyces sp. AA1529]|uniref:hypothetical protein n=1 Tax=Streptomyces sp. AA1529 TaxID=1203257 RepID=UPI003D764FC5
MQPTQRVVETACGKVALRWWAGTAAAMNTWSSLWPNGTIGWPSSADPAAVLLHLAPCLLLTGLAEAIAAYRTILTTTSATAAAEGPPETNGERPPHSNAPGTDTAAESHRRAPAISNELLTRAHALDVSIQQRTGRPASIRYLRRALHLGQARARAVRTHLDATAPAPDPYCTRKTFSRLFRPGVTPLDGVGRGERPWTSAKRDTPHRAGGPHARGSGRTQRAPGAPHPGRGPQPPHHTATEVPS